VSGKKHDPAKRFASYVVRGSRAECWCWLGTITPKGYGLFWDGNRRVPAHRWSYEDANGPIPQGKQIDHLCRVRSCVNPRHMEVVDNRTNILRGTGPTSANAHKTHCKRGHELCGANLLRGTGGTRQCRACKNVRSKEYWKGYIRKPSVEGFRDVK